MHLRPRSIVAFGKKDGSVKWKSLSFRNSCSSPQTGARGLKLTRTGDTTKVEEIWSTRKIQFY